MTISRYRPCAPYPHHARIFHLIRYQLPQACMVWGGLRACENRYNSFKSKLSSGWPRPRKRLSLDSIWRAACRRVVLATSVQSFCWCGSLLTTRSVDRLRTMLCVIPVQPSPSFPFLANLPTHRDEPNGPSPHKTQQQAFSQAKHQPCSALPPVVACSALPASAPSPPPCTF